jgi:hypothetical protein
MFFWKSMAAIDKRYLAIYDSLVGELGGSRLVDILYSVFRHSQSNGESYIVDRGVPGDDSVVIGQVFGLNFRNGNHNYLEFDLDCLVDHVGLPLLQEMKACKAADEAWQAERFSLMEDAGLVSQERKLSLRLVTD